MEFRTLQYVLAVVREQNLSRAAEALHVTQPTLSRQMAQLEDELGTPLFARGRHLSLTDAGIMLRCRAEEVEAIMEKIKGDFQNLDELGGTISIGSGGLNASQILPGVMDGFRKKYPKVQFQLYTNNAEYVLERLEHGSLDFGLLLEPIDTARFDTLRMKSKERWGLLLRASHPLSQREVITREDLMGEPIITSDRPAIQHELENWLGCPFSRLNVFGTYNIITNAAMLVDSGVASALTIEGAANLFGSERMVFRPLFPELFMTSVLAWKKHQPEFGAAARFLEHLRSIR